MMESDYFGGIMKKSLILFVIGFLALNFSGCGAPHPIVNGEDGTYGWNLDLDDLAEGTKTPIFADVTIDKGGLFIVSTILFTLDGSTPAPRDFEDLAVQAEMAALKGTLPYSEVEIDGETIDLRELVKPGAAYFYAMDEGLDYPEQYLDYTVKALEYDPVLYPNSPDFGRIVVTADYAFDPTIWAGDYTVAGPGADAQYSLLLGLLTPAPAGGGFTDIEGTLTVADLASPSSSLYALNGTIPSGNPSPAQLEAVSGLVIQNNDYVSATSITHLADFLDGIEIDDVDHCGNGNLTNEIPPYVFDPDVECP
jgi:hypothetical protein